MAKFLVKLVKFNQICQILLNLENNFVSVRSKFFKIIVMAICIIKYFDVHFSKKRNIREKMYSNLCDFEFFEIVN